MQKKLCVSLLILMLGAVAYGQYPAFTYTTFDVPVSGATNTKAFRINARGDIVGRYFVGFNGPHGFLRKADGSFTAPIDVPGANGTVCRGINARGDIVGRYFDFSGGTHGFLLTADGVFTLFDVPAAAPFFGIPGSTVAEQINNLGEIIGNYEAPTEFPGFGTFPGAHGFLRHTDGTFERIDFPGSDMTLPTGMTDSGIVVGTHFIFVGPGAGDPVSVHGFSRGLDGTYNQIDAPTTPAAVATGITGINDAGDLIGVYSTVPVTLSDLLGDNILGGHPFFLTSNGALTAIDVPGAGILGTSPLGMNARGSVVGEYFDSSGEHGFLASR